MRKHLHKLIFFGVAYLAALFWTRQVSESLFMALPVLALAHFGMDRAAFKEAPNKTIFITLPLLGAGMALMGFFLPGCKVLLREVVWAIWFFLGLGMLLWLVANVRYRLLQKVSRGYKRNVANALSVLLIFLIVMPILLAILSIHRVKYGGSLNPHEIFGFHYRNVCLKTADGLSLSAWFIPAEGSRKSALVCHGLGANKSNFITAIDFLVQAGYHVLIFDFRGHGESDGHTCSIGYWERLDVEAAYRYLKDYSDEIYGVGYSMGAAALLHFASTGANFQAIVLDSPFDTLAHIAESRLFFLPPFLRKPATDFMLYCSVFIAGGEPWQVDNVEWVRSIPTPILIFHGDSDKIIPEHHSRPLQGSHVTRIVAPGLQHVESLTSGNERYRQIALEFMDKAKGQTDRAQRKH